ncbi:MAG: hypothetical protein IT453_01250 [Planctomycetes bacterium]|nr:hypothetical protein [Planctomycetota bacterium]
MNSECLAFRERLVAALEPRRGRGELDTLGWHEHLLSCVECRRVLAAEEALELLLDSLPEPKLPHELAVRVLARLKLRPSRDGLDALLERADPAVASPTLARRVLAGLAAERAEIALDRLLERVPAPEVPTELAARTLSKLALARRRRTALSGPRVWLTVAAAAVIVLGGAWSLRAWLRDATPVEPQPIVENAPPEQAPRVESLAVPSDELLASLSVLESWELLNSDNIDVMLSSLDASDELLLELSSELSSEANGEAADEATDDGVAPSAVEEPRNG